MSTNITLSSYSIQNGQVTLAFQITGGVAVESFDFTLDFESGKVDLSTFTATRGSTAWSIDYGIDGSHLLVNGMTQTAASSGTVFTASATLTSTSISSVNLGYSGYFYTLNYSPITLDSGFATATTGKTVDFLAYSWKQHILLDSVDIREAGANPRYSDNTGVDHDGKASFASVSDASLSLSASRSIQSTETTATNAAVNLQDAIAILKMIVGLPVNGTNQPMSPYQAYAADYDGNGTVALTDAIGVLKHVVGLTAPDPQWVFFNEADTTVAGKYNSTTKTVTDPTHPGAVPALMANLTGDSPVHVGLAGVLRGDVDGSYMGGGTLDMDALQSSYANYFQSTDHGLNPVQFGIYA